MDLYLKITETVYIVFVLVVTLSSLAIPEGDDNGYNTVTMTALSPLAVSRDSDTTNDYESPQSDVVRTYFEPCMVLGQHSHDDSFVAIGGVTRQRHDQWLRKPPVRRCTNVFGSLYVFCVNTVTMTALSPLAVSRDSDTTSDYESPQSDVVRTYLGPCMFFVSNSHDDSFVAIGGVTRQRHDQWLRKPPADNFVVIGYTKRKRYPQPPKSCHHDDYALY